MNYFACGRCGAEARHQGQMGCDACGAWAYSAGGIRSAEDNYEQVLLPPRGATAISAVTFSCSGVKDWTEATDDTDGRLLTLGLGPADLARDQILTIDSRELDIIYSSQRDNVSLLNNPNGNVAALYIAFPTPLALVRTFVFEGQKFRMPWVRVEPGLPSAGGTNTPAFRMEVAWV